MIKVKVVSLAAVTVLLQHSSHLVLADTPKGRGQSTCESDPTSCQWRALNSTVTNGATPMRDQLTTSKASPSTKGNASASTTKGHLKTARVTDSLKSYVPGNLPEHHLSQNKSPPTTDGFVLVADKPPGALLQGVRPGDILNASLEQSIKASASVPTPIRATIESGKFRHATLLGTATLDRELKRILLTFDRLRLAGSEISYALKATGLAPNGQVGLEGDHHTEAGTYFAGEILAATAAGYADATTQRSQNMMGGYQIEPSVQNATKQGAVTALSKTADRLAEQSRNAPEYTEIEAGREIQIIVQETPMEVATQ